MGSEKNRSLRGMFSESRRFLTYHNSIIATADLKPIGTLDVRSAPLSVNPRLSIQPWLFGLGFTQVFRRSLPSLPKLWATSVDQNRPDEPMAHDQWFFFLASALGSIAYLNKPLALYRQHGANTTPRREY